jgi:hypothetical protein
MKQCTFSRYKDTIKDKVLEDENLSPLAKGFYVLNLISLQEFEITDQIQKVIDELIEFGAIKKESDGTYEVLSD